MLNFLNNEIVADVIKSAIVIFALLTACVFIYFRISPIEEKGPR